MAKSAVFPVLFPLICYHFSTILLHTQEVTGSSPVVSTKKFLISLEIRNFSLYSTVKSQP